MDRGAWWVTIHGVGRIQTQLSNWHHTNRVGEDRHPFQAGNNWPQNPGWAWGSCPPVSGACPDILQPAHSPHAVTHSRRSTPGLCLSTMDGVLRARWARQWSILIPASGLWPPWYAAGENESFPDRVTTGLCTLKKLQVWSRNTHSTLPQSWEFPDIAHFRVPSSQKDNVIAQRWCEFPRVP